MAAVVVVDMEAVVEVADRAAVVVDMEAGVVVAAAGAAAGVVTAVEVVGGGERRGIPLSDLDPALTSISHKVIGCARDVHVALGPGYDQSCYMAALQAEMTAQGVKFKTNHVMDVKYKDAKVGTTTADLFIEERFIVTVLARYGEVGTNERSALRAQLKSADLELGLIINFGGRLLKDGLVRVLNVEKLNLGKDEEGHEEGDVGNTAEFQ